MKNLMKIVFSVLMLLSVSIVSNSQDFNPSPAGYTLKNDIKVYIGVNEQEVECSVYYKDGYNFFIDFGRNYVKLVDDVNTKFDLKGYDDDLYLFTSNDKTYQYYNIFTNGTNYISKLYIESDEFPIPSLNKVYIKGIEEQTGSIYTQEQYDSKECNTTSVKKVGSIEGLNVYPNPVSPGNQITIDVKDFKSYELIDLQGSYVDSGFEPSVDTEGMLSGIYFLRITTYDGSVSTKEISVME